MNNQTRLSRITKAVNVRCKELLENAEIKNMLDSITNKEEAKTKLFNIAMATLYTAQENR